VHFVTSFLKTKICLRMFSAFKSNSSHNSTKRPFVAVKNNTALRSPLLADNTACERTSHQSFLSATHCRDFSISSTTKSLIIPRFQFAEPIGDHFVISVRRLRFFSAAHLVLILLIRLSSPVRRDGFGELANWFNFS